MKEKKYVKLNIISQTYDNTECVSSVGLEKNHFIKKIKILIDNTIKYAWTGVTVVNWQPK